MIYKDDKRVYTFLDDSLEKYQIVIDNKNQENDSYFVYLEEIEEGLEEIEVVSIEGWCKDDVIPDDIVEFFNTKEFKDALIKDMNSMVHIKRAENEFWSDHGSLGLNEDGRGTYVGGGVYTTNPWW